MEWAKEITLSTLIYTYPSKLYYDAVNLICCKVIKVYTEVRLNKLMMSKVHSNNSHFLGPIWLKSTLQA